MEQGIPAAIGKMDNGRAKRWGETEWCTASVALPPSAYQPLWDVNMYHRFFNSLPPGGVAEFPLSSTAGPGH